MTALLSEPDIARLEHDFERLETERQRAAQAERTAFERWQDAYGAYQVIRDEASAAWRAWCEAIA